MIFNTITPIYFKCLQNQKMKLKSYHVCAYELHKCLKCPLLARIHIQRRLRCSVVALLITLCSKPHARHRAYSASVHQLSSGTAAAAFLLKFCSQPDSDWTVGGHRSGEMKQASNVGSTNIRSISPDLDTRPRTPSATF